MWAGMLTAVFAGHPVSRGGRSPAGQSSPAAFSFVRMRCTSVGLTALAIPRARRRGAVQGIASVRTPMIRKWPGGWTGARMCARRGGDAGVTGCLAADSIVLVGRTGRQVTNRSPMTGLTGSPAGRRPTRLVTPTTARQVQPPPSELSSPSRASSSRSTSSASSSRPCRRYSSDASRHTASAWSRRPVARWGCPSRARVSAAS